MGVLDILLVEDNDDHAELLLDALMEFEPESRVSRLDCGEAVLDLIHADSSSAQAVLPDVILLDLKMPRCDGVQVLKNLKGHNRWKKVPVFILTTSSLASDIQACSQVGANGYFSKPLSEADYSKVVDAVKRS